MRRTLAFVGICITLLFATAMPTSSAVGAPAQADPPNFSVDVRVDADDDGRLSNSETAVVSGASVRQRIVVSNESNVDIEIVKVVVENDIVGSLEVCQILMGSILEPDDSLACQETWLDWAPENGEERTETVLVTAQYVGDESSRKTEFDTVVLRTGGSVSSTPANPESTVPESTTPDAEVEGSSSTDPEAAVVDDAEVLATTGVGSALLAAIGIAILGLGVSLTRLAKRLEQSPEQLVVRTAASTPCSRPTTTAVAVATSGCTSHGLSLSTWPTHRAHLWVSRSTSPAHARPRSTSHRRHRPRSVHRSRGAHAAQQVPPVQQSRPFARSL